METHQTPNLWCLHLGHPSLQNGRQWFLLFMSHPVQSIFVRAAQMDQDTVRGFSVNVTWRPLCWCLLPIHTCATQQRVNTMCRWEPVDKFFLFFPLFGCSITVICYPIPWFSRFLYSFTILLRMRASKEYHTHSVKYSKLALKVLYIFLLDSRIVHNNHIPQSCFGLDILFCLLC